MYYFVLATVVVALFFFAYYYYKNSKGLEIESSIQSYLGAEQRIPKIIIQTWKTNTVPQRYMELIETVKQHNPDYEYYFFTDDNIETFLKLHYPEYLATYLSLPIKIQKIDFFRYIAVYHYGGFYLDLDMKVHHNFDTLLSQSAIFPVDEYIDKKHHCNVARYKSFCDRDQKFLLGQYAFAAHTKHPFLKQLIDKIHGNIHKYIRDVDFNSHDYIYTTTGPDFVTNVFYNFGGKKDITIIDNGKRQCFGSYATHQFFGTWK